jgi:hypothetical protein
MNIRRIILEEIKLSLFESIEHIQNLYRSWANKKSGNPEAAMKIMDDVINNRRKLPKKDFASYTSYEELLTDLNKIKQESSSEDVTKIYEDKDLLVMAANTWDASCKYGSGTKWCTTAKDTDSYWKRHNETGTEFFWIFKNKPQNDPDHKFSYHIRIKGGDDWCNAINNCRPELPENSYPKQHPMYGEIMSKLETFHNQRDFMKIAKEREVNQTEVENWVRNNIADILNTLDINSYYADVLYNEIDNFISYDIDSIEPQYNELEDDDYYMDFEGDLIDYLESKFDPPFNLNNFINQTHIIADLIYVVGDIPNVSDHISDGSIMDMLDPEFSPRDGYGEYGLIMDDINEIINENMGEYCMTLIENGARDFANRY